MRNRNNWLVAIIFLVIFSLWIDLRNSITIDNPFNGNTILDRDVSVRLGLDLRGGLQALLEADHPSTLIVPLTSNVIDDAEPLRLRLPAQAGIDKDSDLLLDQLRAIDNKRLIQGPLTQCPPEFMGRVDEALREVLDILLT